MFLVSGTTGLLYEVAFSKLLAYVFGATAYAVSTVLASFMGGLALGAFVGGKFARRIRRPLAAYGLAEIVVGLACALSPLALSAITTAYVGIARGAPGSLPLLTASRALITALVVVVPTVAMGATLPLLSRIVAEDPSEPGAANLARQRLATLYAINTLGGAAGALAGAYLVLPALGIRGTMWGAALTNVLLGLIAFGLGRAAPESKVPDAGVAATGAPEVHAADSRLLFFAFASGFLVFATEVVGTHLLALLIGNSAYAFGLMLAVFLVCLAFGAARAQRLERRLGPAALGFGLAASGLALALTLPLWDKLPALFSFAGRSVTSWSGRELVRALAAFGVLVLPTTWMGSTFPLLLGRVAGREGVSRDVARLTVANTVGTILGSLVTGYALLPHLGSEGTLMAVAITFAAAGALAARVFHAPPSVLRPVLVLGGLAVLLTVVLPRWDLARLTSGANVYFAENPRPDAIELLREDVHGGVTSVARRGDVRTMYTNGKFQGDDGAEMVAQRRFAHFPSLFVAHTGRAAVIGLGTGTTLGTIASYPFEHIDVAEISPAIVEASRLYYAPQSYYSLDDPRVALHLEDGRNVLLVGTEPYDLVTMELSSVWFAGAASLYSREFYALVKSRLAPAGILQQWVQLHHIRRQELAVIVHTLRSEFAHVALFIGGGQGILIASESPLVAKAARLAHWDTVPTVQRTLDGHKLESLLDELVTSGAELDRFVAETEGGSFDSTDDNLYLEYATPKGNVMTYDTSLRETIALLERYRPADVRARHLAP
jgi:spermidine synthase